MVSTSDKNRKNLVIHMMHAKELRHSKNDACVPRQNGQGHKYDIEEQCWEEEDSDLRVTL